jgi:hypothetical protein
MHAANGVTRAIASIASGNDDGPIEARAEALSIAGRTIVREYQSAADALMRHTDRMIEACEDYLQRLREDRARILRSRLDAGFIAAAMTVDG